MVMERRQVQAWLKVPFSERGQAKECGARWCPVERKWYAPFGTDASRLEKWLEPHWEDWTVEDAAGSANKRAR